MRSRQPCRRGRHATHAIAISILLAAPGASRAESVGTLVDAACAKPLAAAFKMDSNRYGCVATVMPYKPSQFKTIKPPRLDITVTEERSYDVAICQFRNHLTVFNYQTEKDGTATLRHDLLGLTGGTIEGKEQDQNTHGSAPFETNAASCPALIKTVGAIKALKAKPMPVATVREGLSNKDSVTVVASDATCGGDTMAVFLDVLVEHYKAEGRAGSALQCVPEGVIARGAQAVRAFLRNVAPDNDGILIVGPDIPPFLIHYWFDDDDDIIAYSDLPYGGGPAGEAADFWAEAGTPLSKLNLGKFDPKRYPGTHSHSMDTLLKRLRREPVYRQAAWVARWLPPTRDREKAAAAFRKFVAARQAYHPPEAHNLVTPDRIIELHKAGTVYARRWQFLDGLARSVFADPATAILDGRVYVGTDIGPVILGLDPATTALFVSAHGSRAGVDKFCVGNPDFRTLERLPAIVVLGSCAVAAWADQTAGSGLERSFIAQILNRPKPPIAVLAPTADTAFGYFGEDGMMFDVMQGESLGGRQTELMNTYLSGEKLGGDNAAFYLFYVLMTSTIYGDATAEF